MTIIDFPWVDSISIHRCFIRTAHGEFVHVQLAQRNRARIQQILADRAFIFRLEPLQNAARGLAINAFGTKQVFDAQRDATHVRRITRSQACIRSFGLLHRQIRRLVHISAQRIRTLDRGQTGLGQLNGSDLFCTQFVARFGDCECV